MMGLSDTLDRLRGASDRSHSPGKRRLSRVEDFGSNPGNLGAFTRIPPNKARPPLVVVLHGCSQNADSYDTGTGWSRLADIYGFAVLFAEQKRENNANLCFNWFEPGDITRGGGEVASVIGMIDAVIDRYDLDGDRVYVTGLSAGGAMTAALLATYPDRFAGGAIIAGLPFAGATGVSQAFERMQARRIDQPGSLERLVRQASHHSGPWPTLSVWHGAADHVVSPKNSDAILEQWLGLHRLDLGPTRIEQIHGYPRRTWTDAAGKAKVEAYSIAGMAHGTPIGRAGAGEYGSPGPHFFETDISSTSAIAGFWGLVDGEALESKLIVKDTELDKFTSSGAGEHVSGASKPRLKLPSGVSGIQSVIEKALRSAGLMK
jgi:poly(hydroxyalkanoate) depolymerase family esterase